MSKARRIRDVDLKEDFEFRTISKYIDTGVPILWMMCSLPEYNKIANSRSEERSSVTDFEKWASEIADEAEGASDRLSSISEDYHICMIIGYNEKTNEVAVSDSWGPNYELRWVHIDVARAVTNSGGFVIDF